MNCGNCHIDGGTRPYGNNFSLVATRYPRFSPRSNTVESLQARINDCFERSMNGSALDTTGREMRAIVAYMDWIGAGVSKGSPPSHPGTQRLAYLSRAADPVRGRAVFVARCQTCHGDHGQGKLDSTGIGYVYPPLWGAHSYNVGAGLYQLSKFAGYVKDNMPYGVTYRDPELTDAEAWDVAAFVNSQPRPSMDLTADWPKVSTKPVDYPFGPYADGYSEQQHKYGPFGPFARARRAAREHAGGRAASSRTSGHGAGPPA